VIRNRHELLRSGGMSSTLTNERADQKFRLSRHQDKSAEYQDDSRERTQVQGLAKNQTAQHWGGEEGDCDKWIGAGERRETEDPDPKDGKSAIEQEGCQEVPVKCKCE